MSRWADILDHIGEPIPCEICGKPTPPRDLTETTAPGLYIPEWDMVMRRVIWVCAACPVP